MLALYVPFLLFSLSIFIFVINYAAIMRHEVFIIIHEYLVCCLDLNLNRSV